MKASIVIPAFNEEKNISSAIKAALAQDYSDFEVIVVNNASTDNTAKIASQFPVTLVSESRKGLLYAREKGRQTATGDIIANIDADCLPSPHWLSTGIPLFKNQNVVAVSGPYDYYDGGKVFRAISLALQKTVFTLVNKLFVSLRRGGTIIGGNTLLRAAALEKAGGYDTSILFYGEDTDTAQRVSKYGKIIFNPRLTMPTSARRFKAEGTLKITLLYFLYFFRITFLHLFPKKKKS